MSVLTQSWNRLPARWQMLLVLGLRALCQLGVVLILARILAASAYGGFVAALAMTSIWAPLAGLGTATEALRLAADGPEAIRATSRLLLGRVLLGASLTAFAVAAVSSWLLPAGVDWPVLLVLLTAELLGTPLLELCVRLNQATGRLDRMMRLQLGSPVVRLCGLALWALCGGPLNTTGAALIYLGATLLVLLPALSALIAGPAASGPRQALLRAPALPVALGASFSRVIADADKPLLAAYAGLGTAGCFNLFSRALDLAMLPLYARLETEARQLYLLGANDPHGQWRHARQSLLRLAPLLLLLGIAVSALGTLLPGLLGASYAEAPGMVCWLPLLVLPQAVRQYAVLMVQAQGHLKTIGGIQALAALCSLLLNACLIPRFGWPAALITLLSSEVLMVVCCGAVLWRARSIRATP